MLGGVLGRREGEKDRLRTWTGLRLALEVFGEAELVTELSFCPVALGAFCGGDEERPTVPRRFKGKVPTGPKVMVRC